MTTSPQPPPPRPASPRRPRRTPGFPASLFDPRMAGDFFFRSVCRLAALSVLALVLMLVVFLVIQSWPAMRALGPHFLIGDVWDPVKDDYGALPFIWGTLTTSAIAMLIAVPLSVGSAAFLAEIAPGWLRRAGSFLIELLAAIPSVVYGFWGIFFLAPVVQKLFDLLAPVAHQLFSVKTVPNTGGTGILSAGLILAIMIVPYIAAISYDVCRAVPQAQREASLALGATRWQTIWSVILPYGRPGIIGACFLALGRALGETMAVTMLIGNSPRIHFSLFALGDSIASVIANQLGNTPKELTRSALVELGLVLFLVTALVNVLARLLIWRMGRMGGCGRPFLQRAAAAPVAGEPPVGANGRPAGGARVPRQAPAMARWMNRLMTGVLAACLAVTLGPLFLILGYITYRGTTALNWAFFTNLPIDSPPGLGHAVLGSALMIGLATVFAVPLGIAAAVFLVEFRRSRLTPVLRFVGELLGGVPSVILGIFGYALLVVPFGFSGWAGAFALGVMMVPVVMRSSEEAFKLVPESLRNASYALGAARGQTVVRVLLPAALPAIITGVFLAMARIAGETAPLLLTAYNSSFWPTSPGHRTPFLTYYIYYYSRSELRAEQQQAWAAALVLLVVVMAFNVGVRLLTGKRLVLASQAG